MGKRVLVYGTSYCPDQGYADTMLRTWYQCLLKWNPTLHRQYSLVIADSDSHVDFQQALETTNITYFKSDSDCLFSAPLHDDVDVNIVSFYSNIGRINGNDPSRGQDGSGRAMMEGITLAIENNCDWVVHVETDLFTKGDRWIEKLLLMMRQGQAQFAAPRSRLHGFLETALYAAYVPFLREIDFVNQYNWEASENKIGPGKYPENHFERILRNAWIRITIYGDRNDLNTIASEDLAQQEYGYVTHVSPAVFRDALGVGATLAQGTAFAAPQVPFRLECRDGEYQSAITGLRDLVSCRGPRE